MEDFEKVKKVLLNYSAEDLLKSFFVLNLWLPNVPSNIKSQYLYVIFESIFDQLPKENKIGEYSDFKKLADELLRVVPSFPMMEDYLPENDWGEIKYFFKDKFYKIFYGADLSNPYEFYYAFEILYSHFDDYYLEKLGRSPLSELRFCLTLQNQIITNIPAEIQDKKDITLGGFEVPSEAFWEASNAFLESFNPDTEFDASLINEFTKDLSSAIPEPIPNESDFIQRAHDGKNCFYYFIRYNGKLYPVMPRKYFAALFDKWGKILHDHWQFIEKEVKHSEISLGVELYHFLKMRAPEKDLFFVCSAMLADRRPHEITFTTAFVSKDRLVLFYVLPPASANVDQQQFIETITPKIKEAHDLLSISPTTLGLHGKQQEVQFKSTKDEAAAMRPLIITIIPHSTTELGHLTQPNEMPGRIIGMDQLLGILDEIEDLDDIADFFDYQDSMMDTYGFSPFASTLDVYGAYKDSDSVLVQGANSPDLLVLDPHWGTSYRYKSLTDFWKIYPEEMFFGHPRSWRISEQSRNDQVLILHSKYFVGYVYCCLLGNTVFFINSPIHTLSFEQGKITDSLMGSLADAMILYRDQFQTLNFAKAKQKLHALFFPLSLVKKDSNFKHLLHLVPAEGQLWAMDITRLGRGDFGIRIVYDDELILEALREATDRSIQIQLLVDVLRQIDSIFGDASTEQVIQNLEKEKTQKNRFRVFASQKKVSFPEVAHYTEAQTRELKLADKKIAELAKEISVAPGKYAGEDAKSAINSLRDALVKHIDNEVNQFNLKDAVPSLIRNIDALTEQHERKTAQVKNSLDQEVDYDREAHLGEDKQNFLHHHKNNRYLIEKFVQIQPEGAKDFTEDEHRLLLAYVDRLLVIYAISDMVHYGIYPVTIEIEDDYLVLINYGADIERMQTEWALEHAQITLGQIGNKDDRLTAPDDIAAYMVELDEAFKNDLGFGLRDMVNLQQILTLWSQYNSGVQEKTFYSATASEVEAVCVENIKGFNRETTLKIMEFLTLDPSKILRIEGDDIPAPDLPVWEHRKRATRYSLKPLIKIGDRYYWGAHSTDRSGTVWGNIASANKLPADINAPKVVGVLKKGHQVDEDALQLKIEEIVKRFTPHVETEINPFRLGLFSSDIGDVDVFALLKEKNIILNIESKIIDQAFSHKDTQRIYRDVYGRTDSKGNFVKGYLQKVEDRAAYLESEGKPLAERYWGTLSEKPTVVSVMVTQTSHWWTKNPPTKTDVHFVEVQLLEDFIQKLLS